ncbi:MAG: heavy-metal-associated domain-containing protein [Rhodospirillaceae bacterium]|nr:heavy-metal-associated domain-containing protein [Rhodospirillaceae bacterium]
MRHTRYFLILAMLAAPTAQAETIVATVNGMVCAFCATGIEKSFKKQAAVADIKVDLEGRKVTVHTKPEVTLADDTVTKLITDAGYAVVGIDRQP